MKWGITFIKNMENIMFTIVYMVSKIPPPAPIKSRTYGKCRGRDSPVVSLLAQVHLLS